ncbi:MAG: TIGR01457 family HAD-type hydrolase [Fimbriimonadaceae bacterium]
MYSLYAFDLDGTIYRGDEAIDGAADTVRTLLDRGARVVYLTNNSAATPEGVSLKLQKMGIPCEPAWVYGTGPFAAQLCLERGYRQVHVVGEPALYRTIARAGLELATDRPEAVVVGICRSLTYEMIAEASDHIRAGALFIATNTDATYPMAGGRLQPGAGAVVAAIQTAAGREPEVLGKPAPAMLLAAMKEAGVEPANTLMVGDRYETDILCGQAAGCDTWLVTTGVVPDRPEGQPGGENLRELLN